MTHWISKRDMEAFMAVTRRGALAAGSLAAAACTASAAARDDGGAGSVFAHGVASGDPLPDRVVLWTRISVADPAARPRVGWEVALDPDFQDVIRRGEAVAEPSRDHCVKVDADRLPANRHLYYRFEAQGARSPAGHTRTPPAPGSGREQARELHVALVSCSNFPAGYFNVYEAVARNPDIDVVMHVGDYIYEYGAGGYATQWGRTAGRVPDPPHECLTLSDYRRRFAQYRSDPDLQAAHAGAPWIVVWDDHETSNDAWKSGAENHDPAREGAWDARKAAALQAWYEWMPIRDPEPGRAFEAINRSFEWGDLASIIMLETRLLARAAPLEYATDLDIAPHDVTGRRPARITDPARLAALNPAALPDGVRMLPDVEGFLRDKVGAPDRHLLGPAQEAWLAGQLRESVRRGARWQILGNQVIMARVRTPDLIAGIPEPVRQRIAAALPQAAPFFALSQFGVPYNLDAWDGFPAARARLYAAAKAAGARLVACTGDTHSAWANTLVDHNGETRGVEFGCSSVTSPSIGDQFEQAGLPGAQLSEMIADANPDVLWHDETRRGYVHLAITADRIDGRFIGLSTIRSKTYLLAQDRSFAVDWSPAGPVPPRDTTGA